MPKTIYDKIVKQPRLFEEEEEYKERKAQSNQDESAKYKMYMDRAFLELDRVNKELTQTRIELQNASKQQNGKEDLIDDLNKRLEEQQMMQKISLKELQKTQEMELLQKQREFEHLYKSKQEALDELEKRPATIDAKQLLENENLLTDGARKLLYDKAKQKIAVQQLKIIQELYKSEHSVFPTSLVEMTQKLQIQNKYLNELDDFCQADQTELTEVIRNYYRIKDLEMELIVQNEIINQVQDITGVKMDSLKSRSKSENSGIILDDDDNLEVSLIEHGDQRRMAQ
ncbi:hypothetical protein SS50377_22407 [Spironucleus salmonicida]|uniref:Uncharacterized protein n=1 Tax=Spironucleus salmonicida TaxID=348837 RepID=V6LN03_9EUKA|nr:hypothetical protein SS50377_22407 [Spironucleus salmonicida]|eukprot:EST42099.1 Hypothetical protein SS50377_18408 [Spironucleus salmonicida]